MYRNIEWPIKHGIGFVGFRICVLPLAWFGFFETKKTSNFYTAAICLSDVTGVRDGWAFVLVVAVFSSLSVPKQSIFCGVCNLPFKYDRLGEMVGLCIAVGRVERFWRKK